MKKLLFSLVLVVFCIVKVNASTLYAKITGDRIQWLNASVNGDEVQQLQWQRSDSFNMLPIQIWSPAFYKNTSKSVVFSSKLGATLKTDFTQSGVEFRTTGAFDVLEGETYTGALCEIGTKSGGDFLLKSDSSCGVDFRLDQTQKRIPFQFYRTLFKLPNLVIDFKSANLPAGRYVAYYTQPIAYFITYQSQGINSYQVYQDHVQLVIDYQPSFISAVNIIGDGKFKVEYDTDNHSVKGDTDYLITVQGSINPGIKLSFLSSGKKDDFSLEKTGDRNKIPYNLICSKCTDNIIIDNGIMKEQYAYIKYVGNNLKFNLNFNFKDIYAGDVDEGDYSDTVIIMFELDL